MPAVGQSHLSAEFKLSASIFHDRSKTKLRAGVRTEERGLLVGMLTLQTSGHVVQLGGSAIDHELIFKPADKALVFVICAEIKKMRD